MKKGTFEDIKYSLEKLKDSDGWELLCKDIDTQISSLSRQLRVRDSDANQLKYTTHDIIREMLDYLEMLKEIPNRAISRAQ
ncbi:MAG: hypothetical protein L0Y61_01155 [Epsilonproteobacteria bacterium]|nr:hypothetical protein [Campylobacterota bacterium]